MYKPINNLLPPPQSRTGFAAKTICASLLLVLAMAAAPVHAEENKLPEDVLDAMTEAQATLKLVSPYTEAPVIVVGAEASASERYAAKELSWHLEKMTGKEFPIVEDDKIPKGRRTIAVGRSTLTQSYDVSGLGIEQYVIDVKPDGLVILGGWHEPVVDATGVAHARDRGTLYGVYDFLEGQGVRWYRPEPWGWHVPEKENIDLPVGETISEVPQFVGRNGLGFHSRFYGRTNKDVEAAKVWIARQRLNVRASDEPKFGGVVALGVNHAHARIIPPKEYLESHPEYFALVDGKRGNPGSGSLPQLCLGNPELQDEFARVVIETAKKFPNLYSISMDPEDGTQLGRRMCTCDLCRALDDPAHPEVMSNRVFRFTNIIAKKLAQAVPGARVGLYAYSMHTEVPTLVEKMEPNVVVALANINSWSDWSRKLFDPQSPQNVKFVDLFKDWKKILTHQPWMREYGTYGWAGPLPMYHLLQDRVQSFKELGTEGFLWPTGPNWGPQLLFIYLQAKLQWNPALDLEKEMDLFYENYYGPAAAPMKAYHEAWMKAFESSDLAKGHPSAGISSGGRGMHLVASPDLIKQLGASIAEAKKLVQGNSLYEKRLFGAAAGYELARRINEILQIKATTGERKSNPRYSSSSYLASEEAVKKWEALTRWMVEQNAEQVTFFVDEKDGKPGGTALQYMESDILRNGRYSIYDEKPLLKASGFQFKSK